MLSFVLFNICFIYELWQKGSLQCFTKVKNIISLSLLKTRDASDYIVRRQSLTYFSVSVDISLINNAILYKSISEG